MNLARVLFAPAIASASVSGAPWVFTRQQGCARGCACRHGVGIVELDPTGGEGVDIRSLNILGSVATDPLFAQIIRHDVEDIWLRLGGFRNRE